MDDFFQYLYEPKKKHPRYFVLKQNNLHDITSFTCNCQLLLGVLYHFSKNVQKDSCKIPYIVPIDACNSLLLYPDTMNPCQQLNMLPRQCPLLCSLLRSHSGCNATCPHGNGECCVTPAQAAAKETNFCEIYATLLASLPLSFLPTFQK